LENLITGTRNVALGTFALHKLKRGNRNIAIGSDAIWYPVSADDNVVIGYGAINAMNTNMAIKNNVVIGSNAMPGVFTLASYNVIIGYSAGVNGLSSVTNAIALGYNAKATKPNQCVIGNSSVSEFVLGNKKLIFNQDGTVSWEPVS
jgi:UDP-3-O-[3-hydroxymyristoyl] glucosamine N-acyltransferase